MRFAAVIVAGTVLMLTSPTMTVLAKDTGAQKSEDKTSASSCHAYEQAADGSWHQLPCEEVGPGGQTQHKGAARGREEDAR